MLRDRDPGEFYGYGPAFVGETKGVNLVKVGQVTTQHPKAGGHRTFSAPPPTSKAKALLPKLSDLPQEAPKENARSLISGRSWRTPGVS